MGFDPFHLGKFFSILLGWFGIMRLASMMVVVMETVLMKTTGM